MNRTALQLLAEYGQSAWLDALSRALLSSGQLERLVRERGIRGVTSNSSVLHEAICAGSHYDAQIYDLATHGEHRPETILRALAVADVKRACDVMRSVWQESRGADGYVSLEVDPRLAADSERTYEEAKLLRELVDPPNFMVAIAATTAGVYAVEDSIARGISANAALICSLERYGEVVQAYRRGVERLLESGGDPASVAAVAGVCVPRIDIEVDRRLEARGGEPLRLRGRLAIANAKVIYEHHKEAFGSPRWRALEAIPIVIVLTAIGSVTVVTTGADATTLAASGSARLVLPPLLMIVFRGKYPRWWYDFNVELLRFQNRVGVYLALMDDRYPSTDERQSVRLDVPYPDDESSGATHGSHGNAARGSASAP